MLSILLINMGILNPLCIFDTCENKEPLKNYSIFIKEPLRKMNSVTLKINEIVFRTCFRIFDVYYTSLFFDEKRKVIFSIFKAKD